MRVRKKDLESFKRSERLTRITPRQIALLLPRVSGGSDALSSTAAWKERSMTVAKPYAAKQSSNEANTLTPCRCNMAAGKELVKWAWTALPRHEKATRTRQGIHKSGSSWALSSSLW